MVRPTDRGMTEAFTVVDDQWGSRHADLGPHAITAREADLVTLVGRRLQTRAPEITEGFVAWCSELFPHARMPGGDQGPLSRSVHDNMVTMFGMVASGLRPEDVEPPPNALLWPRKMIQAKVPLGTLMRIYYVGHAMIWHRWIQPELEELASRGIDTSVVSARLHSLSFNYLDRAALRVAAQYHAARAELANPTRQARLDAVLDILGGAQASAKTRQALDFAVDGPHRAWILWLPSATPGHWPGLMVMAQRVHALLGDDDAHAGLTIEGGNCEIWGWTSGPVELCSELMDDLRGVVGMRREGAATAQRSVPIGRGARLAIGPVSMGVQGFRDGYEDVGQLRTAMDRPRILPDSVMTCSQAGLAAVLMADPQSARRFAHRRLGSLAASTKSAETLRATLQYFLSHGASYQRTADHLAIHRNTVLHRLQRCEAELGRPVRDVEHDLFAALLILDWLPESSPGRGTSRDRPARRFEPTSGYSRSS